MKKIIALVSLFVIITTAYAQKMNYKKSDKGVRYSMLKSNKGVKIKLDDIVFLQIKYATDKDSVLFDSWKMGGPIQLKVSKPTFKGDLMDALNLMAAGDSAQFLFSADSMFTKTFNMPLPEFIVAGSDLKFTVKIDKITTEEVLRADEIKIEKEKNMEEQKAIEQYIAENKLTPVTTPSGLKYVMYNEGTGAKAEAGKTVRVHYTGKLLNGTKFDSSYDRNDPIEFKLGQGMVIKGWDEGIALLKEGGKALLIIPSNIAYGARGAGGVIPPFAPLTFEVELVSVQ
jgi:FKBP-type peptidyl-prolyl cis-trans isomerase FkpA